MCSKLTETSSSPIGKHWTQEVRGLSSQLENKAMGAKMQRRGKEKTSPEQQTKSGVRALPDDSQLQGLSYTWSSVQDPAVWAAREAERRIPTQHHMNEANPSAGYTPGSGHVYMKFKHQSKKKLSRSTLPRISH